ncbi:MAG: hypothetical protein IKB54_01145 [Clostridia bacterium]|nr:hypothetical protein [Clostridia bacterium]
MHNAELREAFEKYVAQYQPHWDIGTDYALYNHVNEEISKKYNLDIFETHHVESKQIRFYVKHKDSVKELFSIHTSRAGCITNCAITDVNNDGYIEILIASSVLFGINDSHANVYILDTKTDHLLEATLYDEIVFLKENDDKVVSFYTLEDGTDFDIISSVNGVFNPAFLDKANVLAVVPELNTTKFSFKETSFTASCDLFDVVVQVEDVDFSFPYLIDGEYGFHYRDILAHAIKVRMTYLGETFTYIGNTPKLPGVDPQLVKNEKSVSTSSITPVWGFMPTKHTVTTGMEIDSSLGIYLSDYKPYEVGVYDLVLTYSVNEPGGTYEEFGEIAPVSVYGQIIIEDFLTVTR